MNNVLLWGHSEKERVIYIYKIRGKRRPVNVREDPWNRDTKTEVVDGFFFFLKRIK